MNIIAQLQGGLGNQLFQYATARALANQYGAHLKLDTAWFDTTYSDVTKRDVQLSQLQISADIISRTPLTVRPKRLQRIAQKWMPTNPYIFSEKKPYIFSAELGQLSLYSHQDLYLLGYWQSYKYFSKIRKQLIEEIWPKSPLNSAYQKFSILIQECSSAMVHIRRGDYVHLPAASKVHGFLGVEYYIKGMEVLLKRNPNLHYFVFSDDISWARNHLPFQEKTTFIEVSSEFESATQELLLMSQCKSHLIANSSLSWWGAWLAHGEDSQNQVLCPTYWTNDHEMDWSDLLPKSWERI